MKKPLIALLIVALATPLFADDAKVLPQGVFRLSTAPAFLFADDAFGDSFEWFTDAKSGVEQRAVVMGVALEYGINDWITGAVQWTPGFSLWSDLDITGTKTANSTAPGTAAGGDAGIGRWADTFVGAKFQLLGPNAPIQTEDSRLAIAAGGKIGLPGPDWKDEEKNLNTDKDFIASSIDNNVNGLGARFYYDMLFSENFFLNLFGELSYYPWEGDVANLTQYARLSNHNTIRPSALQARAGGLDALVPDLAALPTDEYDYGYEVVFEIDPQYEKTISDGLRVSAGLPIRFSYKPEPRIGGTRLSEIEGYTGGTLINPGTGDPVDLGDGPLPLASGKLFPNAGPTMLMTVQPNFELFFTSAPVPTAVNIGYRHAVGGKNASAGNAVIIVFKNYLAF